MMSRTFRTDWWHRALRAAVVSVTVCRRRVDDRFYFVSSRCWMRPVASLSRTRCHPKTMIEPVVIHQKELGLPVVSCGDLRHVKAQRLQLAPQIVQILRRPIQPDAFI